MSFKEGISAPDRDNAIDQYLRDDVTEMETKEWCNIFKVMPERLTKNEKTQWLSKLKNVSLASDAFFPFRDNIDRAAVSGVKYIAQPGGSFRDDIVIKACDEYSMVMFFSELRLFHH